MGSTTKVLPTVNPFDGLHVEYSSKIAGSEGGLCDAIYLYEQVGGRTVKTDRLAETVDDSPHSIGELKRKFMLLQWICRYLNTAGHIDDVKTVVQQVAEFLGDRPRSTGVDFLGYELVIPHEQEDESDPRSPFVFYVSFDSLNPDDILRVQENESAEWITADDLEL